MSLAWTCEAHVLACVTPCPPCVGELQPHPLHSGERTRVSPLLCTHPLLLALSHCLVVLARELAADADIATMWSSTVVTLPSTSNQTEPRVIFHVAHRSSGISFPSSTDPDTHRRHLRAVVHVGVRGPRATIHHSRSQSHHQVRRRPPLLPDPRPTCFTTGTPQAEPAILSPSLSAGDKRSRTTG